MNTDLNQNKNEYVFSKRVLRDMSSPVMVLDRKGRIVYINTPAARLLELNEGYREEAVRFSFITEANKYNDRFNEVVFDALYHKEKTAVKTVPYMNPSGEKYVFLMTCSFLEGPDMDAGQLVITLDDETKAYELRQKVNDSSRIFTAFLFGFGIWMLIYALWEFLGQPIAADYMTHGVEVLGLIMLFYILGSPTLSWGDLGIWPTNTWKTIKVALIVSVCAFALLCGFKAIWQLIKPDWFEPGVPFLDISRFGFRQVQYIFTAGIQEFVARSVMQGNLRNIIAGRHPQVMAIILSSLIFAALHIHFGFLFMIGAAILAGLEGILYEKQLNIFGVWIVHWVCGVSCTLLCLIDH